MKKFKKITIDLIVDESLRITPDTIQEILTNGTDSILVQDTLWSNYILKTSPSNTVNERPFYVIEKKEKVDL